MAALASVLLLAASLPASAPAVPVPGLAAAYAFDEGMGASAADASGNGNTGTVGSATWIAAGKFGSALSFNGSNARVTVNDSNSLDLTTAMTLEAWVYPTAGGGWRDVIYKGPDDIYYLEGSSDSNAPATGGTFAHALYGTAALPLNVWSHLAATYDGATLRLYVNAVQVASRPVLAPISTSTGALTIGGDALYGQYFAGRIDEVRIYGTALSASQLQTDMNTPVGAALPPDTQPPTDPTGLSVTAASSTQINLSWNASSDNVGVTGYRLERCQGVGCSTFVQVATPSGTTHSDTGLQPATSYSYRVRAADAAGNLSGYSTVQSASTPAGSGNQPPTAPNGLSATGFSLNQINLAWNPSSDDVGVTGYRVERCQGSGCSNFVQVATPSGTSFNNSGLAASTSYSYRVRAADAAGNLSGYSAVQSATTFQESTVFSGLTNPSAIEFAADGRVFVAEKGGRIKVFDSLTDSSPDLFGDLSANVHNFWDRGMLGFALDPGFTTGRPYVYVLYTFDAPIGGSPPTWGDGCPTPPGATGDGCVVSARLSRLTASGNFMTGPEQVLINDWCQQYPSHSIGSIAFGADGALYVSGGDGASFNFADWGQDGSPLNPCGDPPGGVGATLTPPNAEGGALRSQDLRTTSDPTTLDGAILRVNPDTGEGMPNNPLASSSSANARRIIAHGVRNPFRLTIRPGTNEVWFGDVGWNTWEEINRVTDPLGFVENFGWPCYEGTGTQSGYDNANLTICENLYALPGGVDAPYYAYNHSATVVPGETCPTGSSSTAGVAFYPNGPFPDAYDGALFFADYSRDCIWVMFPGGNGLPDAANRATFRPAAANPVDLQVGPDGALYYADFDGGTIRRIASSANLPPIASATGSPTNGTAPLTVNFDGSGSSDPEGGPLSYSWDLNGDGTFGDSTVVAPTHTFTQAGTFNARLRVTDAQSLSTTSAPVAISVNNTPPTATIDTPTTGTTWKVGDLISFSGSATDPQQGTLPASALLWELVLQHCPSNCHTHPLQTWPDVASGSFSAPDHEYPSHLELRLTATDGGGLTDTKTMQLDPRTVVLSFQSSPSGLQLVVGASSGTTPFTRTVIEGSNNSISASSPQVLGGTSYTWESWSDGGAQSHNIVANAAGTYTATYQADTQPPSAPSGLSAVAASSTQINLAWGASSDNVGVTGYRVERCQDVGCSNFVQVATPSGTSYNDTGLQPATSYSYRVRAVDAPGNLSGYSNVQSATTQAATLCLRSSSAWLTGMEHGVVSTAGGGIFSSVTGTPTADNTIVRSGAYSLRIADASNGSTVRVLRSVTASSVFVARFAVRLASLPTVTSNLAYIDSGTDLVFRYDASSQRFQLVLGASTASSATTVSAATWYVIDLRYDLSGNLHLGDWRVDGAAQTQVSRSATPATANGFGMGATGNASIYTANYDDILLARQATSYPLEETRIVRILPDSMGTSSSAGNFRNDDGTVIDANSWQRVDDVPMTSAADYVRQQVNSGTSYIEFGLENTAETCIRDVSMVLAYHAAGTPADNGKTSAFDGATETVVFSGDMSQTGLQYKSGVVAPTLPTWNQAAVNGLVARVGYSTDSSPNPYWDSVVLEVATANAGVDTTPPATPGNLTAATASSTQVDLAWSASTDDVGVTGYQVERCQGASCANFALVSPVTGTSYADTGLTPSTVYRYRVRARDGAGNFSGYSAVAQATTEEVPDTTAPSVPTGLSGVGTSISQIELSWTASDDDVGVTGYSVFRDGVQVGTSTTTSFQDGGLAVNTSYAYRVSARDAAGNNSAQSASVNVSTLPTPDTQPPSASMTAPSSGSTVSGVVTVAANATDNVGVAEVDFLLDGVSIGLDATAPYSVQWNTTTSSNGQHNLSARARDTAGNFGLTSSVVSVTVNNPTTPPLPANLMAGWNFNEGQGTTTTDATGNGNTATFQNDPVWAAGKYGSGIRLDGVDDFLSVLNSPTINVSGNALTVSTWLNPLGGSGDQVLFGKFWNAGMTPPYYQYGLELHGNGRIPVFFVGTAAGYEAASMGSALALGQWSHLAVTFDGSLVRFYLDGNLVSSPSIGATTVTPRDTLLYLGSDVGPRQFFNGSLDDLRIYNRTLAQGDIQSDMSTPLAAGSTDPSAPTVAITFPANNAQVGGSVTITADADDDVGVAGVRFFVDGLAVGPEDVEAPYGANWDTRTYTNGAHTITARARDTSGNVKVATPVNANVVNSDFFQNEVLATGFDLPTAMKFLPDGRMLVAELRGKIKIVPPPYVTPDPTPFLQLSNLGQLNQIQQGIFDLALDPNYAANHHYYIFYTFNNGNGDHDRLSRFTANTSSTGTIPGSEFVLYEDPGSAQDEHHGGGITFANDGKILFTTGDHFAGSPAQDLTNPRGKIHRIDRDGTVPTDNPFHDGAGPNWDSVWARGLRNPFRAYYDSPTGRLFVGDVGGNDDTSNEEVNLGVRGANFGWPNSEGQCASPCTSPLYDYEHNSRDASVTGGFVYHGTQFPASMQGSYFFGDYAQNWIKRLTFDADGNVTGVFNFEPASGQPDGPTGDIVYLTEGPDGSLFYIDLGYSDTTGSFGVSKIRRIRYLQSNQAPIAVVAASPTSGSLPLVVSFSSAGSNDPEGEPLTYSWDFGDGSPLSTDANPVHIYTAAGQYTVRLTVSDGSNFTFSTPISIQAGGPPTATIVGPLDAATFRAGDVITLSGGGTDPDDGDLPASAFTWNIDFLHDGHVHPGQVIVGSKTGSFSIPTTGHDFAGNTRYRISLRVTDSNGLSDTKVVTIWPEKVNLTFETAPATGLTLYLDGIARTAPFTVDTLIDFHHVVEARNQTVGNNVYTFASWSDGGTQTHTLVAPSGAQSYTASFTVAPAAPTGLMVAWGFNEGAGTSAADSSGNNNTATLLNGLTWGTGKYGSGLSFDGANDYLTAPNSPSLDITGTGLTLSMWLRPSTGGTGDQVVLGKHWNTTMTSPYYQYGLELQTNGTRPVFMIGTATDWRSVAMTGSLTKSVWSHLAIVWNGSTVQFYVNGAPVSSGSLSASMTARGNPLRLGADADTGQFYGGLFDDMRIYNRAQTAAEVQADMNTGI